MKNARSFAEAASGVIGDDANAIGLSRDSLRPLRRSNTERASDNSGRAQQRVVIPTRDPC